MESEKHTIKSITKNRYAVAILEDKKGIFWIVSENFLTHKIREVSLIDYTMACAVFDNAITLFEGN